ncbi:alpha-2-macroglobulin family protein [Agrobacterium vaccinii]|uniref:alpha-2-macroglobulin family protein n=1 Tax=Agrobacterium vaccinii TaxID=2735528 RepID=UPI001E56041F|nr:alpha-2-macroglobulin family protein [Agrobacterium vaccinii]UHS59180.1 alpha-2-macroglobulin family protein [Agrobacterium vaccinii]
MSMRAALKSLLLVVATFAFQPVSAQEMTRKIVTTQNGDYFGFDLRTEQNVSQPQCETICINDASCKAFTYNPKVKWCFLKSDFNQLNAFPGAVAGKVVEVASEPDIGAPQKLSFVDDSLYQQARRLTLDLPAAGDGQQVDDLLAAARQQSAVGNDALAVDGYKAALALAPDDGAVWAELSRLAAKVKNNYQISGQAASAALNAYSLSRTLSARTDALNTLAQAFEKTQSYRAALDAYKASLALSDVPQTRAIYADLRTRQGFRVIGNTVDTDSVSPRACIQFSEPLVKNGVDYTSFVTLDGAPPKAIEAKGSEICVEALTHGQRYKIALRAGLPSSVEEPLEKQVDLDIYVRDRSGSVRFTGENFVLPGTARRGIPLVSVNIDHADLKLYRVGDRNITALLSNSQFLTQMDGYGAERIETEIGELVWQGAIDIKSELNKDVATSFPVDEALPERKPGIYMLTAVPPGTTAESWDSRATQWFLVSDTGITTYAGTDGLNVFVRALSSAKPLEGVSLHLLAKNNEILGTATTDGEGRATFSAGLMRGTAGQAPAIITARNGEKDYVFLDMTRAGFDLSDRGVTGRAAPGAIDVFSWTERGIYRAGETVHAAALARDIEGNAVENLPLTFIFSRPDGVEDRRFVSDGKALGGHAVDLPLQENAMRGTWTLRIYTDPKTAAISEKSFLVDDFVPDRTEFDLTSKAKEIDPAGETAIDVDGRYLYGAPAAGLELEGEIALKPTRTHPGFEGYMFGLADEETEEESRTTLDALPVLDENGKATFNVTLADLPSTTQFLSADITVRMREAGGRAVERSLTLPVKSDSAMIGIKPQFSGDLAENSIGRFHVIGLGADGAKKAMSGLPWKLIKVERNYQWYRQGSSWRYEPVVYTKQVETGTISVDANGGEISVPASWGRYRLEVESPENNGPVSSVEFDAGWYVSASSTETPDALEIALDKQSYKIGDTAKLQVTSRFSGQLMVASGSEKLIAVQNVEIGDKGGEIDIPVTKDWGAGSYVTATLFRPGDAQESRMPMRAIGIKWLAVDPGERKLGIALDLPKQTLPRQPLEIPIHVSGAGAGEKAYVTLAAVDVGILNLTRYEPPKPDEWYFGQRRLGLEIRDIYGRLIDGSLGATGRLRTGGDGGQTALQGSPPTEKLVAFFEGPVELDADGKATVRFDIPQFNGTARVMAVAWTKTGVGHAVSDVVIRDPVVITASAPKFLSPGDVSQMRIDIANTDGEAGDYTLAVASNMSITVDEGELSQTLSLQKGGKTSLTVPLTGENPGNGAISIKLSNASGLSLEQALNIPVRPAVLPVTTRRNIKIAPNSTLTVDGNLLAESMLLGSSVAVNVTRSPAFDVPALVMMLDKYPYGCAEQTTSRALPLLYVSELMKQRGGADDPDIRKRVQEAIYRVLSFQSSSGSFGLWGPGEGDLWLDSYITDFLTRAREQSYDVPETAMVQALTNLQNGLAYDTNVRDRGNEIAYSLYVLARNRKAAINDLRYYADTALNDFPTPLAKAQLASALSLYGDAVRSKSVFGASLSMASANTRVSLARADYGSALRDGAASLALAAESRPVPAVVPQLASAVAKAWDAKSYTSTQEQAWMLLAARALQGEDKDVRLDVNGALVEGGYSKTLTGDDLLQSPIKLTNASTDAVTAVVTTVAPPAQPLPAGGDGFDIQKTYYSLAGEEVNISEAHQNERYVVVINVTPKHDWQSRIMLTDLLPSGFEIDNPSLVNSAALTNFDWLPETETAHTEFRYDRFVAAFDRTAGDASEITLAYVVRAVTPGTYDNPAATVEDMYRPQFSARTATGRMEVRAAQK